MVSILYSIYLFLHLFHLYYYCSYTIKMAHMGIFFHLGYCHLKEFQLGHFHPCTSLNHKMEMDQYNHKLSYLNKVKDLIICHHPISRILLQVKAIFSVCLSVKSYIHTMNRLEFFMLLLETRTFPHIRYFNPSSG